MTPWGCCLILGCFDFIWFVEMAMWGNLVLMNYDPMLYTLGLLVARHVLYTDI